jgi:hypothetical protein
MVEDFQLLQFSFSSRLYPTIPDLATIITEPTRALSSGGDWTTGNGLMNVIGKEFLICHWVIPQK